jgi:hypothetical protein
MPFEILEEGCNLECLDNTARGLLQKRLSEQQKVSFWSYLGYQ